MQKSSMKMKAVTLYNLPETPTHPTAKAAPRGVPSLPRGDFKIIPLLGGVSRRDGVGSVFE